MLLRAAQALYNYHKAQGRIHLPHGDSLLFGLSCAQIMYAVMLRPDSIPYSYYLWVIKTSQADRRLVALQRAIVRNDGVMFGSTDGVVDLCKEYGMKDWLAQKCKKVMDAAIQHGQPIIVPCDIIHSRCNNCFTHQGWVWYRVIRQMFPVNLALNLVPAILLKHAVFRKE